MSFIHFRKDLVSIQTDLIALVRSFARHGASDLDELIGKEADLISTLQKFDEDAGNNQLHELIEATKYLFKACFLIAQWQRAELTALVDPGRFLQAAKKNVRHIEIADANTWHGGPLYTQLIELKEKILALAGEAEVNGIFTSVAALNFPFLFSTPKVAETKTVKIVLEETRADKNPVISVLLYIDGNLWENPQVFKPDVMIDITGTVKIDSWPEGYDKLILHHVSTTDDSWFKLSLPIIERQAGDNQEITGNIIFHHSQRYGSEAMVIKLFAQFISQEAKKLNGFLLGYNELKVNIFDHLSYPDLTPYPLLNERMRDILSDIAKNLKNLSGPDKEQFRLILAGVLRYMGYCTESGIYKEKSDLKEAEFRDDLIKFLTADSRLTKRIVKESEIAGGRVEILYEGIPVELKVEKKTQDRKKIIDKYKKQAITYASASDKQLSILLVLEMTKKTHAPALNANNVEVVIPEHNGFKKVRPMYDSRLVVVFIDANTGNPSKR